MHIIDQMKRAKTPLTYGDILTPAMEITDQVEADTFKEAYVRYTIRLGKVDRTEALRVVNANLGYFAGYYDNETRGRVERLFRCAHPVSGEIAVNGPPAADDAILKGVRAGLNV